LWVGGAEYVELVVQPQSVLAVTVSALESEMLNFGHQTA